MNPVERAIVLQTVREVCAKDPSMLPEIIDMATVGVKDFAAQQREDSAKLAAMLMDVLHSNEVGVTHLTWFTPQQIADKIEPWFKGTAGMESLKAKHGIVPQESPL